MEWPELWKRWLSVPHPCRRDSYEVKHVDSLYEEYPWGEFGGVVRNLYGAVQASTCLSPRDFLAERWTFMARLNVSL